jgi:hypothetical protein
MADKTVLGSGFGFSAFLADELTNFIIDNSLIGLKIVTTLVYLAVTLGTYENLKTFVDFFGRDFPELSEADIAVGREDFLIKFFVSG